MTNKIFTIYGQKAKTKIKTFDNENEAESFFENQVEMYEGKKVFGMRFTSSCANNNFSKPIVEIDVAI